MGYKHCMALLTLIYTLFSPSDFGDIHVRNLVDIFGTMLEENDISPVDAELEWNILKRKIYDRYYDNPAVNMYLYTELY